MRAWGSWVAQALHGVGWLLAFGAGWLMWVSCAQAQALPALGADALPTFVRVPLATRAPAPAAFAARLDIAVGFDQIGKRIRAVHHW